MRRIKNFEIKEDRIGRSLKINIKVGTFLMIAIADLIGGVLDISMFDGDGLINHKIIDKPSIVRKLTKERLINVLKNLFAIWLGRYIDNFLEEDEKKVHNWSMYIKIDRENIKEFLSRKYKELTGKYSKKEISIHQSLTEFFAKYGEAINKLPEPWGVGEASAARWRARQKKWDESFKGKCINLLYRATTGKNRVVL